MTTRVSTGYCTEDARIGSGGFWNWSATPIECAECWKGGTDCYELHAHVLCVGCVQCPLTMFFGILYGVCTAHKTVSSVRLCCVRVMSDVLNAYYAFNWNCWNLHTVLWPPHNNCRHCTLMHTKTTVLKWIILKFERQIWTLCRRQWNHSNSGRTRVNEWASHRRRQHMPTVNLTGFFACYVNTRNVRMRASKCEWMWNRNLVRRYDETCVLQQWCCLFCWPKYKDIYPFTKFNRPQSVKQQKENKDYFFREENFTWFCLERSDSKLN